MDDDGCLVLAAVLTGGFFVVLLVLLAIVLIRRWWRGREAVASSRGFVLFGVCFPDDRPRQRSRTYRRRASRGGEAAGDDEEPGESELARWKKMFGGPARCLSTIEEGTEKGTTAATTPVFCSPPPSPDRRDGRTTLQAVAGALQS